jgi:hypothetical protein
VSYDVVLISVGMISSKPKHNVEMGSHIQNKRNSNEEKAIRSCKNSENT